MCYQCFLLGAQIRADCVNLSNMACFDYFFYGNQGEALKDKSAELYLQDVLSSMSSLGAHFIPIKVEGDGNCLVHSISRSIGGTEHLYSVLRAALTSELVDNEAFYKSATSGFYHHDGEGNYDSQIEWARPTSRAGQWMSPLHIFGLSNVLKRPIILLDGRVCPEPGSNGRGLYLPTRFTPADCTVNGQAPSPILISWSSSDLNHYVCLSHVMHDVNQEQPIGRSIQQPIPAGLIRACRAMRSVLSLQSRIDAIVGLRQVLSKCQQLVPPKLKLNANLSLAVGWAHIEGVHDFLREVGFFHALETEVPAKRSKPFDASIVNGTSTVVVSILLNDAAPPVDLQDHPMQRMLEQCEVQKPSDSDIILHHSTGLVLFMKEVERLSTALSASPNAVVINKKTSAVLESLRFLFRSKILSKEMETLMHRSLGTNGTNGTNGTTTTTTTTTTPWSESPVLLCIGMLQRFNRDKEGRKNVSLVGVLKTFQLLCNLLALSDADEKEMVYHTATLKYLTTILKETEIFLTKVSEQNNTPLCNFNHPKAKTKDYYTHIATSISVLLYNCSVIAYTTKIGRGNFQDQLREETQQKLIELKQQMNTQVETIYNQMTREEITPEASTDRILQLETACKASEQKIIQSMHNTLFTVDDTTHSLCVATMQVCGIYLNKTWNIDVVEKTYKDADQDVMQAIYTILYGDSRRAGVLVHACKDKTEVVGALMKRKTNAHAQKVLAECCVPIDTVQESGDGKSESKSESKTTLPQKQRMVLHMPVVDSIFIKLAIELLENEMTVASTCARDCQCGSRISATKDMIVSGDPMTCPQCSTQQHITVQELETYQSQQATEMRTTSGCTIPFDHDRELFTNVWFADALFLGKAEEQKQSSATTLSSTNSSTSCTSASSSAPTAPTASTASTASLPPTLPPPALLRSRSVEMMEDIWNRARMYAGTGEWSFASGQSPSSCQRGTLEDTKRHFRVMTGGLDLHAVISQDTESMYKFKCRNCTHLNGAPCDISTMLVAGQTPLCANCKSSDLIQMPPECTYQDTIMAVVNGTLKADELWTCQGCTQENGVVHARCPGCGFSRPLASIMVPLEG